MQKPNKWYLSTPAVIAWIFLFFPVGIFLMWKYTSWHKGIKWAITAWIMILLVIAAAQPNEPVDDKQSNKQMQTQPESKPAKQEEPPKQEAESTKKPLTTIEKLWAANDDVLKSRDNIDIAFDASTGYATITYSEKAFLDNKAVVEKGYINFALWGEKAAKVEGVQRVISIVRTEFTDSYGKKNMNNAVSVSMDVAEFNKYDWRALRNQPIHTQLRDSGILFIHPAVMSKVNLEEVKLRF